MRDDNPFRLTPSIRPIAYRLKLRIDPDRDEFEGEVSISIEVDEPARAIELNLVDLTVRSAVAKTRGEETPLAVSYRPENEIVLLEHPVGIPAGQGSTLEISFVGKFRSDLSGLYRSVYTTKTGEQRNLATTQFESTGARKAFPCFDEPEMKATFQVTLEVPSGASAISNYPQVSRQSIANTGYDAVAFSETMRISSYLLAFIVGDLVIGETVSERGVPIRVIHVPGKEGLDAFALDVAGHAVRYFEDFFDIAFPAPKLDLIAIPDFAFGAMENLGAVTFRETALLIDPDSASQPELERVCDVVCHEIAHMWFGDLVTMKWWNGIWLNEAFATFMEVNASDAYRPEWRKWDTFGIARLTALGIDSLPSTRPIEFPVISPRDAEGMFDPLTYEKGGGILKMVEQFLGEETFRKGVKAYLLAHSYGNAETTDLFDALAQASGQPVSEMMQTWINQGGHPLVSVDPLPDGVRLAQAPFRLLGEESDPLGEIGRAWHIPLMARTLNGEEQQALMTQSEHALKLGPAPVVVNAHGWGIYRTRYSQQLLVQIADNLAALETLERFNLFADTWAMVIAGQAPLSAAIELFKRASNERDPNILQVVATGLRVLNRVADRGEADLVKELARAVFRPILDAFGIEPGTGENPQERVARSIAFETLGTLVLDSEVIEAASEWFREEISGVGGPSGDLAQAVLATVAKRGDEADFAFILDRFRHPKNPQDERRHLFALAGFEQHSLASRLLSMCLTEIRTQDAPFVIGRVLANPAAQEIALDFIFKHYDELLSRLPGNTLEYMLEALSLFIGPDSYLRAPQIFDFFKNHKLPRGERGLQQTLDRLTVNLRFRANVAGSFASYL